MWYNTEMNGEDRMKIAAIQGLISEVHRKLKKLSNTNPEQLEARLDASAVLHSWEEGELYVLQQAFQEVETS